MDRKLVAEQRTKNDNVRKYSSRWIKVKSGMPQGSVLELLLFST
jgi:hypothetical protein